MRKKFLSFAFIAAMLVTGFAFSSCSDDDDDNINYNYESVISFENLITMKELSQSGTFQGPGEGGLIMPGQTATFTFSAAPRQAIMFATMYGYSNDLFFSPDNPGIDLFRSDGTPITGDVSHLMHLWDNGTRINVQPSAENPHQGAPQNGVITEVTTTDAQGNLYQPASQLVRVNLAFDNITSVFTLTITNNTGGTVNETPLSPGVWAVANIFEGEIAKPSPFFEVDGRSSAQMTALAETGNNQPLANLCRDMTGIITPISSVIVVVYTGDVNPIFQLNQRDAGIGMKQFAETGDASRLGESLNGMANVRHVYVAGSDDIIPGRAAETVFRALANDKIAYVTKFGYSNDWFFANSEPIGADFKGDLTSRTVLLDNGTAVNQYPGAGYSQHAFGGTPIAEDNVVSQVGNTPYPLPAVANMIRVTVR